MSERCQDGGGYDIGGYDIGERVVARYEGRDVPGLVADVHPDKGVLVSLKRSAMLKTRKWFPADKVRRP